MTMVLAAVTHDIRTNTLEATWLKEVRDEAGELVEYQRARCHSYSPEQADLLRADLGADAEKYITMAGW